MSLFPNHLKDFEFIACFHIARLLLNLQQNDLPTYESLEMLRKIKNAHYGCLNSLEIDNTTYAYVLTVLKQIVDDLTQTNLDLQLEARSEIQRFESIKTVTEGPKR